MADKVQKWTYTLATKQPPNKVRFDTQDVDAITNSVYLKREQLEGRKAEDITIVVTATIK